jgi:hypothetical protein
MAGCSGVVAFVIGAAFCKGLTAIFRVIPLRRNEEPLPTLNPNDGKRTTLEDLALVPDDSESGDDKIKRLLKAAVGKIRESGIGGE